MTHTHTEKHVVEVTEIDIRKALDIPQNAKFDLDQPTGSPMGTQVTTLRFTWEVKVPVKES